MRTRRPRKGDTSKDMLTVERNQAEAAATAEKKYAQDERNLEQCVRVLHAKRLDAKATEPNQAPTDRPTATKTNKTPTTRNHPNQRHALTGSNW